MQTEQTCKHKNAINWQSTTIEAYVQYGGGKRGRSSLHLERAGDPKHWNLLGKEKGRKAILSRKIKGTSFVFYLVKSDGTHFYSSYLVLKLTLNKAKSQTTA